MSLLVKTGLWACIVILVISVSIITQQISTQPITREDVRQQLENLISFSNESALIIALSNQNNVNDAYKQNQIDYINQHVNNFYSQLASKRLPQSDKQSLTTIGEHVFNFSMQLKAAEDEKDPQKLLQIQQNIQGIKQFFQSEEKRYE